MALMVFFGCTLIAFGPSLAIFFLTILQSPIRILLVVAGAFFWLLALLLSSLLWTAVVPLRNELAFSLVFSVLFQELARFALFKLLDKSASGLDVALSEDDKASIADFRLPYVSGFGFGLLAGTFSIVNVLSNSVGPGNVGIGGSSQYFFLVSAILTSAIILLHVFWNVILSKAFKKENWPVVGFVTVLHMIVSCVSLVNTNPYSYWVSILVSYVTLFVSGLWAFTVTGGTAESLKAAFSSCIA